MKLTRRISLLWHVVQRRRWIDWRRRDLRDAVVIFSIATVAFLLSSYYEVFEQIHEFAQGHEDWQVDELFMVSFVLSVAMIIFGYRRIQDLSREIAARRAAEREARKLSRHDPLTGLPNRRYFTEKLDEALRQLTVDGRRVAVLILDLDGFKPINDLYGHAAGDQALIAVAERISAVIPPHAVLARIGGDEFALILPRVDSLDDPTGLARRIVGAVAEPFAIASAMAALSAGIGISVAPDDGIEPEELVRRADLALYRAKAEGRSSIRFFEEEMDAHVERRMRLERELRTAIATGLIVPYFQPLVSLDSGGFVGFEALARWKDDSVGSIPPDVFIAIAEESGLINELGDQVLRGACQEATRWPEHLILACNISPVQLRDPSLGLRILSILGETGLNPHRLELEITENALVSDMKVAREVVLSLREAGVRIAIDDFGTGYATLSQLLDVRFDKIKIDRSFVARLGKDSESNVIVRAILGLANGFGMTVTAEGIEDKNQLTFLKQNGCLEGQGYLFSKAVPASQIQALLAAEEPAAAVG